MLCQIMMMMMKIIMMQIEIKKKLCDADKYYGNSYEKMTSINYMTVSIDIYQIHDFIY